MSRRSLFGAGTLLAAAAAVPEIAGAQTQSSKALAPDAENIIRQHYRAWDRRDWHAEDMLLADDFTFSSAAGDDHIPKNVFKTRCWDNNVNDIKGFDLLHVFGSGNEALVMYDCLTMDNKTFRNVEYLRVGGGKLEEIVCYFGATANYPAAVSARKA
ncbi:MAG TPA: nuclear transport factor 2 family protein [Rhizomicrobium sp.]|jgi:hypothetical protein|nr:nuclear transport factor 2 family protein [Rhizomicrobium sp.]